MHVAGYDYFHKSRNSLTEIYVRLDIDMDSDFAERNQPKGRADANICGFIISWVSAGINTSITVFPLGAITAGRKSGLPICLRIEPDDTPENRESSIRISREHFRLTYRGTHIELVPLAQGSLTEMVDPLKGCLPLENPYAISDHTRVRIGGVLDLEIRPKKRALEKTPTGEWAGALGVDQPGEIDHVNIFRLSNRPECQYALLFHEGLVAPEANALVEVPPDLPLRQGRHLDLGDGDNEAMGRRGARLFVKGGACWVESRGKDSLALDGVNVCGPLRLPTDRRAVLTVGPWVLDCEPFVSG